MRIRIVALLLLLAVVAVACAPAGAPDEAAPAEDAAPAEEISAEGYEAPEPGLAPVPLEAGAQASCALVAYDGSGAKIAYMPPATEFNYYHRSHVAYAPRPVPSEHPPPGPGDYLLSHYWFHKR